MKHSLKTTIKTTTLFILIGFLAMSCQFSDWEPESFEAQGLYVVSMSPDPSVAYLGFDQIELFFSQPLQEESVNAHTVFVIQKDIFDSYDDWQDLAEDIEEENISVHPATLSVVSGQLVCLDPSENLSMGIDYKIVALPSIQSQDHMFLDQSLVEAEQIYFVADLVFSNLANSNQETGASSATYPETNLSQPEEETETVSDFDWQRVLITEVVTDPQQDHNESQSENGILFDAFPGLGTVGSTDEYIEIFNGTDQTLDVSEWSLRMLDGTDEMQELNDEELDLHFSNEGNLQELGPGEFLVVGNPAGSLNNAITIELLDQVGEAIDTVTIEDANSDGMEDEAYYLLPDGSWDQGYASPGYFIESE